MATDTVGTRRGRQGVGNAEQGIALISVLLLLIFVLTIVAGLFYRHQIHIQKVSRAVSGEQALLLLLSAESWAQSLLEADAEAGTVDHLGEIWARPLPLLPVEGGEISGCIRDLAGLLNINNLGWYSIQSWADELALDHQYSGTTTRRTFFRDLLLQLGLDASDQRIATITDWVDVDTWLLTPDSAEDSEYLLLDPSYRAANQPLAEIGELALLKGYSEADVAALRPHVSTLPEQTPLNVNTAPGEVLVALLPLVTAGHIPALTARRPFATVGAFYDALSAVVSVSRESLLAQLPAEFLAVKTHYFGLRATLSLGGMRYGYESVIQRPDAGPPRVIARTLTFIPRLVDARGGELALLNPCNDSQVTFP